MIFSFVTNCSAILNLPVYKMGILCLLKAELWRWDEIYVWKSFVNCKKEIRLLLLLLLLLVVRFFLLQMKIGIVYNPYWQHWQSLVFKICEKVENVVNFPSCLALVKYSFGRVITFSILKYSVSLSIQTMWGTMSYV